MNKTAWGPCIWTTLHLLTIKLKENSFIKIKEDLIKVITDICSNLPCPSCSTHATLLLKKYKIKNVKKKEDLVKFIFNLHNEVNRKLKKPKFTYEELEKKYKSLNFKNEMNNYYNINKKSTKSSRMMLYNFHKDLFMKNFKVFIINNINCFEE
jgi:exonuclease VII large subunit